jgi:hypothetical protein
MKASTTTYIRINKLSNVNVWRMTIQRPSNLPHSWVEVETSAAADADRSPSDLIVVSLPKKFDVSILGFSSRQWEMF